MTAFHMRVVMSGVFTGRGKYEFEFLNGQSLVKANQD